MSALEFVVDEAAAQLGLEVRELPDATPWRGLGYELRGSHANVAVEVTCRQFITDEYPDASEITCGARLTPPLRLGLGLDPKSSGDWLLGDWSSATVRELITDEFAQEFHVRALDFSQIAVLIASPVEGRRGTLGRELISANQSDLDPHVTDDRVDLRAIFVETSEAIVDLVTRTTRIARGLLDARPGLPPTHLERAVDAEWAHVARGIEGRFDAARARIDATDTLGRLSCWLELCKASQATGIRSSSSS